MNTRVTRQWRQIRQWRQALLDDSLNRRLAAAGCPCTLEVALATAGSRHGPLKGWVRSSLAAGLMLRTSQAEHVAAGDSLAETARITGTDVTFVIFTLTRFEIEMAESETLYT